MISNWILSFLFIMLLLVPTVIIAAIGWWAGRRLAFGTFTTRLGVIFAAALIAAALVYAAVEYGAQLTSEDAVVGFDPIYAMFLNALIEILPIALIAAGISWVVNKSSMKAKRDAGSGDGDVQ